MCEPLEPEEYRIQPRAEVSPPWWNLGHTSWFFARNVLAHFGAESTEEDRLLDYVLNSYYVSLGARLERGRRGLLTRPTNAEVLHYRESVDARLERLIESLDAERLGELERLLWIGLNHEQQHQELFYTEIKSIQAENPPELRRSYAPLWPEEEPASVAAVQFVGFPAGLYDFGNVEGGRCWDNELPVHPSYLQDFSLADRLVTNGEYLEFMEDGGYRRPLVWLSNGWDAVESLGWQAPLYWERVEGRWRQWTLRGWRELVAEEPVCHVSFYEADAFARWKGEQTGDPLRLPSEREWEHAARTARSARGNVLDQGRLHPAADQETGPLRQMLGDVWEWTSSYYEPYPGYQPFSGSLSEYNGKFMDSQRVLRGGSCVTPGDHLRLSYRNFWAPTTRFQFSGIRLARGPQ